MTQSWVPALAASCHSFPRFLDTVLWGLTAANTWEGRRTKSGPWPRHMSPLQSPHHPSEPCQVDFLQHWHADLSAVRFLNIIHWPLRLPPLGKATQCLSHRSKLETQGFCGANHRGSEGVQDSYVMDCMRSVRGPTNQSIRPYKSEHVTDRKIKWIKKKKITNNNHQIKFFFSVSWLHY